VQNAAAGRPAIHLDPQTSGGVRISRSEMAPGSSSIAIGGETWSARGVDLKTLIATVYEVDLRRVEVDNQNPAADARFDVTAAMPSDESWDSIQRRLLAAIEKRFNLDIERQTRTVDVYVLTAPFGPGPQLRVHRVSRPFARAGGGLLQAVSFEGSQPDEEEDAQRISYTGKQCSGVAAGGISATAVTIAEFRRTLEPDLDLPLVDETGLAGGYDFRIAAYRDKQELFQLMREQLGIAVTATQRNETVLAVRAR
jgi:uncharacterized protein (TIGR03435 family)